MVHWPFIKPTRRSIDTYRRVDSLLGPRVPDPPIQYVPGHPDKPDAMLTIYCLYQNKMKIQVTVTEFFGLLADILSVLKKVITFCEWVSRYSERWLHSLKPLMQAASSIVSYFRNVTQDNVIRYVARALCLMEHAHLLSVRICVAEEGVMEVQSSPIANVPNI
jgi:hypothetical protein